MEQLKKLLEKIVDDKLLSMVLSGRKSDGEYQKVRIRPLCQKGELLFQASAWDGKKEYHSNYGKEAVILRILDWMKLDFKQLQAETTEENASVLISKKGKVTIKEKVCMQKRTGPVLSHNRTKQYLLKEGIPVPFLVRLGVMTPEGKVIAAKYDKFRQINRFLEFIEDICPALPSDREISMIDFGCGKSYLTFAMYYYLHEIRGYQVRITGLDLKKDVIEHCSALAEEFGYEGLSFQVGDIAQYDGQQEVDLVVTLHACDTATDYALAKAAGWKAKVILSVPCCQHELNGQIQSEILEPVLQYGLLKERIAALMTDGLRAQLLEAAGYQVQILEFIDMEHTPKNILIRAVRRPEGGQKTRETIQTREKLEETMKFLGVNPTLYQLLQKGELR